MFSFTPFPELETANLILRRISVDDTEDLFSMRSDPRMHEHTDTKPDETTQETRAYIEKMNQGVDAGKWVIWAIQHKRDRRVIGSMSIWNLDVQQREGELGYGIAPAYWGQGFMKESLLRVIDYAFSELGFRSLHAYTAVDNLPSLALLEKCGFTKVKTVDEEGYYHNRVFRMSVFTITNPGPIPL